MGRILGKSLYLLPEHQVYILASVLALVAGSFITAVSYRVIKGESFVSGRSKCPKCQHSLGFKDLFPIFSWLFQLGKCRYCKVSIHWKYPVIELAALLLTIIVIYRNPALNIQNLLLILISLSFLTLCIIDLETYLIYDVQNIIIGLLVFALFYFRGHNIQEMLLASSLLAGGALLLRYIFQLVLKKDALGLGDVKLLLVAAPILNLELLPAFLFGAGASGVILALVWRRLGKGDAFPFGPSLAASFWVCLIFPEFCIGWKEIVSNFTG
jgi:prepilin signal peptidase PulO-like enzyme (type II secretory pathway)